MKKSRCCAALLLVAAAVFANAQERTLFDKGVEFSPFGALVLKTTDVDRDLSFLIGARGGFTINRTLSIGAGAYGLVNDIKAPVEDLYLDMAYGGLEVEYIHFPDNLIHPGLFLLVGGGAVSFRDSDYNDQSDEDVFFVIEPAAFLEMNITTFFRLSIGAGYRSVSGVSLGGLSNADLSGFSGNLSFVFDFTNFLFD
jgi:hypothetical protein